MCMKSYEPIIRGTSTRTSVVISLFIQLIRHNSKLMERALEDLRNKRIGDTSRKTYASPIAQFLLFMWHEKQHLLRDDFIAAVNAQDVEPSISLFRCKLPGMSNDSDSWPPPLHWERVTAEVIMEWLLCRYEQGSLTKSQLNTKRSAIHCLFKDYGASQVYASMIHDLSDLSKGLRRKITENRTFSGGEVREGKLPLSFNSYRSIGKALQLEAVASNAHCDGPFNHLYFVLMWNLMCRASNCSMVKLEHLEWRNDALVIFFSRQKTDQTGDRSKYPRHVYANPLMPEICPILSLGVYWLSFGIQQENGDLFSGRNQYDRFSKGLKRAITINAQELGAQGITAENIGAHSCRKGCATYCSSGSTACPPSTAINIRAGWTLGGVEDTYKRFEAAGDQYVGRVSSGLPMTSANFMMLPPAFKRYDSEGNCLDLCVLEEALQLGFGVIPSDSLKLVAEYCLASVVYHYSYLKNTLPVNHRIFGNPVLACERMMHELKQHLWCGLANHSIAVQQRFIATGIPPHVLLLATMDELRVSVEDVSPRLESAMEKLPTQLETMLRQMLEDGAIRSEHVTPQFLSQTIRNCLLDAGLVPPGQQEQPNVDTEASVLTPSISPGQYRRDDGTLTVVPSTFTVPSMKTEFAWVRWVTICDNLGPWRHIRTSDIPTNSKRRWTKYKFLMDYIMQRVQAADLWVDNPNAEQAREMFNRVKDSVQVEGRSHRRRHAQLTWSTVVKNLQAHLTTQRRNEHDNTDNP